MRFQDLMQRLAVELRLDELLPNENGACAIEVDGLHLDFFRDPDGGFTLICPLGLLELADVESHALLLQANLFGDGVGGSALGMDPRGRVYLCQRFAQSDWYAHAFFAALQRFVAVSNHWRQVLTAGMSLACVH